MCYRLCFGMELKLGTVFNHCLWPNEEASRLHAASEAANTGGTVLRIRAIEIRHDSVLFVGTIPTDALQTVIGSSPNGRRSVQPRGIGNLHTSCNPDDPIGFLVLHHPVNLVGGRIPEEGDLASVAVEAPRPSASLPVGVIGPICCQHCNEPIARQRLQAVPRVRSCTQCKSLKEKT